MSVSFYAGQVEGPNLSNRNARIVLAALGLDTDDLVSDMPVRQFIGRCQSWLRANLNKPSSELATIESGGETTARFIDCGLPEGYVNTRIYELCRTAQEGLESGASEITWS